MGVETSCDASIPHSWRWSNYICFWILD